MDIAPPRLATRLLRAALGDDDFEAISGDLEEAFRADVAAGRDPVRARLWYWRQVASIAGRQLIPYSRASVEDAAPRRIRMGPLRQDLGYAFRSLVRQPAFTAVAVLTLALCIGANIAMFSLINAVLFAPLPFANPDRLMAVHLMRPDRDHPGTFGRIVWSYPKYDVFRRNQQVFDSIALFTAVEWNTTGADAPERIAGEMIEATYLRTLGVTPAIGRDFTPEETRAPGSAPIVLLGHGLWLRRFGGAPSVLGRSIGLDGIGHTIVGVLPSSFRGLSGEADLWVPVMTRTAADLGEAWNHSYSAVALRKRDVSPEQAEAAARVLGAQVSASFEPPGAAAGIQRPAWTVTVVPLDDERVDPLIKRSMLLVLAAVAAVLLIVCVNLGNLVLVRALSRQQEVAIRLALGASRGRILRLMMTENLLLALLGGIAGVAVAIGSLLAGASLLPDLGLVLPEETGGLTRVGLTTLGADWRTLLFAATLVAATSMAFGLGAAWRASGRDLATTIRPGTAVQSGSGRRLPIRHVLIAVEVALALILLTAGGLMVKSVARLQKTELGFASSGITTARIMLPSTQYDNARGMRLFTQLIERLQAHPRVQAAAYAHCAPLSGACNGTTIRFPNRPAAPNEPSTPIGVHWASPTYFQTLGIRVVRGRTFTGQDTADRPRVVVVNERAARAYWPDRDPIGQRVTVGQGGFHEAPGAEIVGIVADVRYGAVERSVSPDVYLPLLQSPRRIGVVFIRSTAPAEEIVPILRAEARALDPDLPLVDIKTMGMRFGDATWRTRTSAWLLGAFSLLALVLAAIGIYGVVSQSVAQRARELGVRVALGATRRDILRLVLGRASAFAAAGVGLGIALAIPAMRLLTSLLYQVEPGDPAVLAALAATLLAVAVLASYLPARRAMRVSPLAVLRGE
jgi:putative ABC transport system permease protein